MPPVDKNYTECEKCPDGIYKNEDQHGFVYCDRCDHKVKRDGMQPIQEQAYSSDPLAGAVTVDGNDTFGGFSE